jgi:hypothetical protein
MKKPKLKMEHDVLRMSEQGEGEFATSCDLIPEMVAIKDPQDAQTEKTPTLSPCPDDHKPGRQSLLE